MRRTPLAALVIVLLLGAYLRVYRLGAQSYWNDEGNTLRLAQRPAAEVIRAAAADIHPPLYYLLLKPWHALTGDSEFALRAFSALAGLALAALLYRLGREYFGRGAGLGAALLGAVHPFLVYYSQEARMYALLAALSAASFLLFSLWLRSSRPPAAPWGRRGLALGYVLATAAGLYTHYAFGFVVIAQNLAALGGLAAHRRPNPRAPTGGLVKMAGSAPIPPAPFPRGEGRAAGEGGDRGPNPPAPFPYREGGDSGPFPPARFPRGEGQAAGEGGVQSLAGRIVRWPRGRVAAWLGLQALTLLLFLPWLPTALRQLSTWPAERAAQPLIAALADLVRYLLVGQTLPTAEAWWGAAGAGVLLAFGLRRRGQSITPLLWLLVPAGLTLGLGLLTEAFSKFLLAAVPAVCVLLGAGLGAIPVRAGPDDLPAWLLPRRQRLVEAARMGVWLAGLAGLAGATFLSLNNLYFDPAYARDDYRGMVQSLAGAYRPGDAVILIAPNQWETFSYYHRTGAPVYPLPRTRPLDAAATVAELEAIAAAHARLFVLFWGEAQADPGRVVEGWLNTRAFKAGESWHGGVRLATYAAAAPAAEPQTRVEARFGDHLVLEGFALRPATLAPGDILQVTLFWRADARPADRYKVFVHVDGEPGQPPLAQQDGEPSGGLRPTTEWTGGERVADNHGVLLPAGLPAGEYTVRVGLYNTFTTIRLPVTVQGQAAGDSLPLTTISVKD